MFSINMSTEKMTGRQSRLAGHYVAKQCSVFGADDYTLVAPSPSSVLLSDENITIAFKLFGDTFDRKLRSLVIVLWFPGLLCQLACFPIVLLTLIGRIKPAMAISTFPGALFPVFLLLRSHWAVFGALAHKWEALFLTAYSIIFCVAVSFFVKFDVRQTYIWLVIFPALLASTFADASAVRLDCAFLKGQLSMITLTMPPYIVSLAYICSIIALTSIYPPKNDDITEANDALPTNSDTNCSHIIASTGVTICLFICKSAYLLLRNPYRCNSLSSSMTIGTITLKKRTKLEQPSVLQDESTVKIVYDTLRKTFEGILGSIKRKDPINELDDSCCEKSFASASENSVESISQNDGVYTGRDTPIDDFSNYLNNRSFEDREFFDFDSSILESRFNLIGAIGLDPFSRRVLTSSPPECGGLNPPIISNIIDHQELLKRSQNKNFNGSPWRKVKYDIENAEIEPKWMKNRTSDCPRGVINRRADLLKLKVLGTKSSVFRSAKVYPQSPSFGEADLSHKAVDTSDRKDESRIRDAVTDARKKTLDNYAVTDEISNAVSCYGCCPICNGFSSTVSVPQINDGSTDVHTEIIDQLHDCKPIPTFIIRHDDTDDIEYGYSSDRNGRPSDASHQRDSDNLVGSMVLDYKIDMGNTNDTILNERQKRLLPYYEAVKAVLFGPDQYTLLAPCSSSIIISDENITVAYYLFGEKFDNYLRLIVRYAWYPALFLQMCCFLIGLLTLLGILPDYAAVLTIPGAIFPVIILLQCHWKIYCLLLYDWEQIFLTSYSILFCVTLTLTLHWDFRSVYIWFVIFPALYSSACSDASATRLDHFYLKKAVSTPAIQSIFSRALLPYLASFTCVFSIVAILNLRVALSFNIFSNLQVHTVVLSTDIIYSRTASSTGFTVSLFLIKYMFGIIRDPMTCVSLRFPMTIGISHLEPRPRDPIDRANGHYIIESKFSSNRNKSKRSFFFRGYKGVLSDTDVDMNGDLKVTMIHFRPFEIHGDQGSSRPAASRRPHFYRRLSENNREHSTPFGQVVINRRRSESDLTLVGHTATDLSWTRLYGSQENLAGRKLFILPSPITGIWDHPTPYHRGKWIK